MSWMQMTDMVMGTAVRCMHSFLVCVGYEKRNCC